MTKILVVEDDFKLGQHLVSSFQRDGHMAALASTKDEVEQAISSREKFDVLILDRLLDNFDCKSLMGQIKRVWPESHVLVLSAINTPNERTELLNLGADDYMGKPFSTQEVLARVNALRRRVGGNSYTKFGNTIIDYLRRSASVDGVECILPTKEFLLLKALINPAGKILSKFDLLDSVWGQNPETETNVVEATVTNLRRRLTELGSDIKIKNMRNAGYWIED